MDRLPLHWRALSWLPYWMSWAVLALAWLVGTGLGISTLVLDQPDGEVCRIVAIRPLMAQIDMPSMGTLLWHAVDYLPVAFYLEGLAAIFLVLLILLPIAAFPPKLAARNVLSGPVIALAAIVVGVTAFHLAQQPPRFSTDCKIMNQGQAFPPSPYRPPIVHR